MQSPSRISSCQNRGDIHTGSSPSWAVPRVQLEWASAKGRVIVAFNVAHFAELHATWLQQGRHHAGIIVSSQRPIGDMVRRLLHLSGTLDAESMGDRLKSWATGRIGPSATGGQSPGPTLPIIPTALVGMTLRGNCAKQ